MKIDAYANLNRDCISVRSRESEDYGLVVAHEQQVRMRDVEFTVQPAGQERCRETGVKNVHAFVRGEWDQRVSVISGAHVIYDPYTQDSFFTPKTGDAVSTAETALVTRSGVYADGVR